jgi:hypothetical protein
MSSSLYMALFIAFTLPSLINAFVHLYKKRTVAGYSKILQADLNV